MNLINAGKLLAKAVESDLPVMLWGPPGVGKSSLVHALAIERGVDIIDLRLAQLDATDLRGIPVPDHTEKLVRWYPPAFLPRDGEGILFLDEIDKAPSLVKSSALQLVLDRRLGDYVLPKCWSVIGAGNREEDGAFSTPLGAALANRMLHITVDPDLETWLTWAKAKGLARIILDFLRFRPELLYKQTNENAFPSPRTWEAASRLVSKLGDDAERDRNSLLAAAVGDSTAAEFSAWAKLYRTVDVEAILAGKTPDFKDKEASFRYAVVLAVACRIDAKGIAERCYDGLAGLLDAVTPELRVLLWKSLSPGVIGQLVAHPSFKAQARKVVGAYMGA